MAILLVKIDTEKNTYTVLNEKEEESLSIWTIDKVIEAVAKWYSIEDIKTKSRGGSHSSAKIVASVLLKDLFRISNSSICELLGYSLKKNSSNVVSRNIKIVCENKDVQLYPVYKRLKRMIDGK